MYRQTIMAKTCDTLRVLLPAATRSNVGIYATGQSYEQLLMRLAAHPLAEMREYGELMLVELRKVIPAFLKRVDVEDRGVAWSEYWRDTRERLEEATGKALLGVAGEAREEVTLVDHDPDGEVKVVAAAMYASSALPDDQLLEVARAMTPAERAAVLEASVGARSNRRHKPGRSWERTSYRFDVLTDYGAFRDLQRHRPLTIEWQSLTTAHGYEIPPEIDEAGLRADWERVLEASAAMEQELAAAGHEEAAQYAVSMAYRIRFVMQMSAREAMHLVELRSQPQGHPTYRRVAQAMHAADRPGASGHRRRVHVPQHGGRRPRAAGGGAPHRGEAEGSRLVPNAGVHVHVVPSVLVQQRAPHDALELESGPLGDAARGLVLRGMVDLEPVQSEVLQGPASHRGGGVRGRPRASEPGQGPVRDVAVTELEVHRAERHLPSELTGSGIDDRPAGVGLRVPPIGPRLDPRRRLVPGRELAHVPVPDVRVVERARRVRRRPSRPTGGAGWRVTGRGSAARRHACVRSARPVGRVEARCQPSAADRRCEAELRPAGPGSSPFR